MERPNPGYGYRPIDNFIGIIGILSIEGLFLDIGRFTTTIDAIVHSPIGSLR